MATPEQTKAFSLYDFETDPNWVQYRQNLEIPVGRNTEQVLAKYKAKYYKANVDPTFVISPSPAPSTSSAVPPRTSFPTRRSTVPPQAGAPPASGQASAPAAAPFSLGPLSIDHASLFFLANAWVSVMALVAFFPIMPSSLSRRGYRLALWGALATSIASLYRQTGVPRSWTLAALQAWLVSSLATPPFLAFLYLTIFLTSPAVVTMAVVPVAIPAVLASAAHLRTHFGQAQLYRRYLSGSCLWLEQRAAQARLLQANVEVGVGFSLIFQLLTPQRNFLQLFVYWNLLKIFYHAPPTSYGHRAAWAAIQQRMQPVLVLVPALKTPISYIQNWFLRV